MLDFLAIMIVITATGFSTIGVLGLRRLPDVYTRLHATGKVGVLGVTLLLVASVLIVPAAWSRAAVLIVLLIVVGPVTAHALASAAYRIGIPMRNAMRNELSVQATDRRDAAGSQQAELVYRQTGYAAPDVSRAKANVPAT